MFRSNKITRQERVSKKGRKSFGLANSLPFDKSVNRVGLQVLQLLGISIGPANFEGFDVGGTCQAEMQAQIVLRKIAGPSTHFAELHHAAGMDGDASANSGAIAFRPDQVKQHAMVSVVVFIPQQRRRLANIQDDNVHIAGIENVAEGGSAA